MSRAIELARELVARPSVTPNDAGCQDLIASHLAPLGFTCEAMPFGAVQNLWARRGTHSPVFCFAGHTDVVPAGNETTWSSPPFSPVVADGRLFGRGSADMKGALAAMVTAVAEFLKSNADHRGSIAFLLTSDEEGPAIDGTRRVIETLAARGDTIDWCVVGEPSSNRRVGDTIRVGRRGSLYGHLRLQGSQGHVAYPDKARNPIHAAGPIIESLCKTHWDSGNRYFPPTTFQVSNIRAGTGALNVIPGELEIEFSFRYSTEVSADELKSRVTRQLEKLDTADVDFSLDWTLSGEPFFTRAGALIDATTAAVTEVIGAEPEKSTGGGTSDGRFIAPFGAEVVELGLCNSTIHKVDECTDVADIEKLAEIYRRILETMLGRKP
jgi:succinyl-diaminopimelate desuccinylase